MIPARIEAKINRKARKPNPYVKGACHPWMGAIQSKGYGVTWMNGRTALVHRFLWSELVGEIPAGLAVSHSCKNPLCCNINHMKLLEEK